MSSIYPRLVVNTCPKCNISHTSTIKAPVSSQSQISPSTLSSAPASVPVSSLASPNPTTIINDQEDEKRSASTYSIDNYCPNCMNEQSKKENVVGISGNLNSIDSYDEERLLEERIRSLTSKPVEIFLGTPKEDELNTRFFKLFHSTAKNKDNNDYDIENNKTEQRLQMLQGDNEPLHSKSQVFHHPYPSHMNKKQINSDISDNELIEELISSVMDEVKLENDKSDTIHQLLANPLNNKSKIITSKAQHSHEDAQKSHYSEYSKELDSSQANVDEVNQLMKQLQSLPSSQLALNARILKPINFQDSDSDDDG